MTTQPGTNTPHAERTRVRRHPERGVYEQETIAAILDEALYCHVGFTVNGQPYVLPTIHARVGNDLYIHGAAASRMLGAMAEGVPVCVTATLLDGLVLARSVFSHSMNYRSAVILGVAADVADEAEKNAALEAIVEHVVPGRWREARHPSTVELRSTRVLKVPLDEASAKVRTGGPKDASDDLRLPVWAGVIPLALVPGAPIPDAQLSPEIAEPDYVRGYRVEGRRASAFRRK